MIYIKLAFRNLIKRWPNNLASLITLSMALSVSLFLLSILYNRYQFDTFHRDYKNIYRVITDEHREGGYIEHYATTPLPLADYLETNITGVKQTVRVQRDLYDKVTLNGSELELHGLFTEPSFFQVFGFSFKYGNPEISLKGSDDIVLTEEMSVSIFGQINPVGKTIDLSHFGTFQVVGVLNKIQSNTHFDFQALISLEKINAMEKQGKFEPTLNNWDNYHSSYVYTSVEPNCDIKQVENSLAKNTTRFPKDNLKFSFQPIQEITLGTSLSNQMGKFMSQEQLILLGVLALLILVIASMNYSNLVFTQMVQRLKSSAIMKVNGADSFNIIKQSLVEILLFGIIVFFLSQTITWLIQQKLNSFHFFNNLKIVEGYNLTILIAGIVFVIVTLSLSAFIPTKKLSRVSPAVAFRGIKQSSKSAAGKVFLGSQILGTLILIMTVLRLNDDMGFIKNSDFTLNHSKDITLITLHDVKYNVAKNQFGNFQHVKSVTGLSHPIGTNADHTSIYKFEENDNIIEIPIRDFFVDYNFLKEMNVDFLAGDDFQATDYLAGEKSAVINEKAAILMGYSNFQNLVGKQITVDDSILLTIKAVIKDFNYKPLNKNSTQAVVFRYHPEKINFLLLFSEKGQFNKSSLAEIKEDWRKLHSGFEFTGENLKELVIRNYGDYSELLQIFAFFSGLAMLISCLGLFATLHYLVKNKTREIAIRHVFGGSYSNIVRTIGRPIILTILVSLSIAIPIAILIGQSLSQVNQMSDRGMLLEETTIAVSVIIFITFSLTLGYTYQAVRSLKVGVLRNE